MSSPVICRGKELDFDVRTLPARVYLPKDMENYLLCVLPRDLRETFTTLLRQEREVWVSKMCRVKEISLASVPHTAKVDWSQYRTSHVALKGFFHQSSNNMKGQLSPWSSTNTRLCISTDMQKSRNIESQHKKGLTLISWTQYPQVISWDKRNS